jgi:uncharacterized membrane-anchored protein
LSLLLYLRYSILGLTATLMVLGFVLLGRRPFSESFAAIWSAVMLCALSIGGTMIMRKYHNSMAVGFFMGCVVASSQLMFSLFLMYLGYGKDQADAGLSRREESLMALLAFLQSVLLGSFAAILAAHRSEILDKPTPTGTPGMAGATAAAMAAASSGGNDDDSSYLPPPVSAQHGARV